MTRTEGETQAVVLSGGSAYAAYEVGVLKALMAGESPATHYRPLHPTIVSGSSAGSFNAAILVSQPGTDDSASVNYLEKVWSQDIPDGLGKSGNGVYRIRGDLRKFLDPVYEARHPLQPLIEIAQDTAFFARDWLTRTVNFAITRAPLSRRVLQLSDLNAVLSIEPFTRLLRQAVHLEAIRDSDRVLRIATTNWRTGELRLFTNADMTDEIGHKIILASCTFPGLHPVDILGEPYVDGGYVMETPLSPVIAAGADVIHVVYLDPDVKNIPLWTLGNTIDTLDKVYVILMATIFNRDIAFLEDIDRGLELLEGAAKEDALSEDESRALLRLAGRMGAGGRSTSPHRKIVLHRYHPDEDLGGILGLLNYDREHILELIARGFQDALEHDCTDSGCILPQ